MAWFHRNLGFCILVVSVLFAASALADEPGSVSWDVPATNHPALVLSDGRVLVAGGMAISAEPPEYEIGAASEMWDPRSGEWRTLNSGLGFEPGQRVYLNQMADGRVLLFAVRSGNKAEYQARTWDPKSDAVEKLLVGIQPQPDVDVGVLADGRVLIVNGAKEVADIWSSRGNSLAHFDEPLFAPSRWRVLPLDGARVLLVETFPDDAGEVVTSRVLSWDLADGGPDELAGLPDRFTNDSSLSLRAYGEIQAGIGGAVYTLPALDGNWESESGEPAPEQAPAAGVGSPAATPTPRVSEAARRTAVDSSWKESYVEEVRGDLRWMFVFVPIMVLLLVVRSNDSYLPYMVRAPLWSLLKWLVVVFFVLVGWILLRHGPLQVAQAEMLRWWDEYREGIFLVVLATAILGPILGYFLLRRMEEEKQERVLARGSLVARAVLLLFIVYLVAGSAVEEYDRREQGANVWRQLVVALDHLKWILLATLVPAVLYLPLRRFDADKTELLTRYANKTLHVALVGLFAFLFLRGMWGSA